MISSDSEGGTGPPEEPTSAREPLRSRRGSTEFPPTAEPPAGEPPAAPPPGAPPSGEQPGDEQPSDSNADTLRATYGVRVVYVGFAVVLISFLAAVVAYAAAADVSTALAPVTGVVGTIVGAYFGVQVGSQGKETSERLADQRIQRVEVARQEAERDAVRMAAVAPPGVAAQVLGMKIKIN